MAITIGKLKCIFCKNKRGFMHSVHQYGEYGAVGGRYHYHPQCLELVQIYPTSFDHRSVDMAIQIVDLRSEHEKRFNDHIVTKYQEKIKKLESSHFERMMPKKQGR